MPISATSRVTSAWHSVHAWGGRGSTAAQNWSQSVYSPSHRTYWTSAPRSPSACRIVISQRPWSAQRL